LEIHESQYVTLVTSRKKNPGGLSLIHSMSTTESEYTPSAQSEIFTEDESVRRLPKRPKNSRRIVVASQAEESSETEDCADYRRKSTRVRFTLNNYTHDELAGLATIGEEVRDGRHSHITYLVYGQEVAPTTGTPHLQGYCEFKSSTWNKIRSFLGPRCAFKSCEASGDANDRYCKKDGRYCAWGTLRPGQGARSDLKDVASSVMQGNKLKEVAKNYPEQFIKYHQGITRLIALQERARTQKPLVLWFSGPSGTGKSWTAYQLAKMVNSYYYKDLTIWWDRYEQQNVVIFDDFRQRNDKMNSSAITFVFLLRLFDQYALTVQYKGGYTEFNSPMIIVSCPYGPEEMFAEHTEEMYQLTRRIDHHITFNALTPRVTPEALLGTMPVPIVDLVSSLKSATPPSADEMPIPEFPIDDNLSLISGLSQDDIQSL